MWSCSEVSLACRAYAMADPIDAYVMADPIDAYAMADPIDIRIDIYDERLRDVLQEILPK